MAASVDKKVIDCYWFLQNQCRKGDACEYRHSYAALENNTTCKFWTSGQCHSALCIFRHPSGAQAKGRSPACIFYAQRTCSKGDACPFRHESPELVNTIVLEARMKEEENLRKVQAERKKEEERLAAKMKAEREQMEAKRAEATRRSIQENKTGFGGTFQRSVGDLVKDSVQQRDKSGKVQKKAQEPVKEEKAKVGAGVKSRAAPEPKQSEAAGPISYGVKSLDLIMQERTTQPSGKETAPSEVNKAKQDDSHRAGLQKNNGTGPQNEGSEAPKRKNSPEEQSAKWGEEKRQRVEPEEADNPGNQVDIELDPDAAELAELLDV